MVGRVQSVTVVFQFSRALRSRDEAGGLWSGDLHPQKAPRVAADGQRVSGFAHLDRREGLQQDFCGREGRPAGEIAAALRAVGHAAIREAIVSDAEQPARDGRLRFSVRWRNIRIRELKPDEKVE